MKDNSPFLKQAHQRQSAVAFIEPFACGLASLAVVKVMKLEVPYLFWIFLFSYFLRLTLRYLHELQILERLSLSRKSSVAIQEYWGVSNSLLKDDFQQFKFEVLYFVCASTYYFLTFLLISWYFTVANCVPFSPGHAFKLTVGLFSAVLIFLAARSYFVPLLSFQLGWPIVLAMFRVALLLDIRKPIREQALQSYGRWLFRWLVLWLAMTGVLITKFACHTWTLTFCISVFCAVSLFRLFFKAPVE